MGDNSSISPTRDFIETWSREDAAYFDLDIRVAAPVFTFGSSQFAISLRYAGEANDIGQPCGGATLDFSSRLVDILEHPPQYVPNAVSMDLSLDPHDTIFFGLMFNSDGE